MSSDDPDAHPARHARVWLDPTSWREHVRDADADAVGEIDAWVGQGRALVARRRDPTTGPRDRCLGLALPLARRRRRIGLVVDRSAVLRVAPPLSIDDVIADVIPTMPSDRRAALYSLRDRAADVATPLAVYGSYAWQAIAGEPCVTPDSDIDLLWDARDDRQVARMLDVLSTWERGTGIRADGEVRFAGCGSVAWRELRDADAAARILVKWDDGVALVPRSRLFDLQVGGAPDQREDAGVVERAVES